MISKILFIMLVVVVFSGLALAYHVESFDGESYKVKLGKHHKSKEKVCWNKECSWNRDVK